MPVSPVILFLALVWGHALGDYPLQGDFLAKAKNQWNEIPGAPWYQALGAHAVIQAGIVAVVMHMIGGVDMSSAFWYGLAEFVLHTLTDYGKNDEKYGFNVDQLLHVLAKALYIGIYLSGGR